MPGTISFSYQTNRTGRERQPGKSVAAFEGLDQGGAALMAQAIERTSPAAEALCRRKVIRRCANRWTDLPIGVAGFRPTPRKKPPSSPMKTTIFQ
jgi:hypothetical protein